MADSTSSSSPPGQGELPIPTGGGGSDARGPAWSLRRGDAVALLRSLPTASVDLMVTDPAYESLEKHRAVGTTTRLKHSKSSSNDWFSIFPNARFGELFTEAYRVLKRDTHLYLFCDQETMFVAKPIAEQVGFKFWKPLIWDKCLGPETPVRTTRGVVQLGTVQSDDQVYTPAGEAVDVLAVRRTRAPALRIAITTGGHVLASEEHRFALADGRLVEARALRPGDELASGTSITARPQERWPLADCISDDEQVVELPDTSRCLSCGREFDGKRAAAAHQARFCESARSKECMAQQLGVAPKRLRRWMSEGRLPTAWARELGIEVLATGRMQLRLQHDSARWFPEHILLDYGWGKLIGLFAAEGWRNDLMVSFALHRDEKHLRNHIARMARCLGLRANTRAGSGNGCVVEVCSKLFSSIIGAFVGGDGATTKFLRPPVYAAPNEFQRGVFDGLIEGDGHWSDEEQRETLGITSLDLASFALRFARHLGWEAVMHRHENDHAGYWKLRFDPWKQAAAVRVVSIEQAGDQELVDIAIDHPDQLFVLHDGVVTHNCRIGMGYHYRSRYELVLFFEKGKRKLADLGVPDVLSFPRIHRGYPSEKPSELSEIFIRQSTDPGALVVDPFTGSGSVGVAALRLGRRFLGGDVSATALGVAGARLAAIDPAR